MFVVIVGIDAVDVVVALDDAGGITLVVNGAVTFLLLLLLLLAVPFGCGVVADVTSNVVGTRSMSGLVMATNRNDNSKSRIR